MATSDEARWALGVFFIVMVATLWAGSSVLTQYIYDNLHFDEPFVLTYLGTSLFAIYLPSWAVLSYLEWVENPPWRLPPDASEPLDECFDARKYEKIGLVNAVGEANELGGLSDQEEDDGGEDMTVDEIARKQNIKSSGCREVSSVGRSTPGSSSLLSSNNSTNDGGDLSSPILSSLILSSDDSRGDVERLGVSTLASPDNSTNISSVMARDGGCSGRAGSLSEARAEDARASASSASGARGGGGGERVTLMSHTGTARVSLLVCPLWFLANWSYNQSLSMTSVTSSTIISTTSSLFSFVLSVCFAGESFTLLKLCGVGCCMGGTVLVTLADSSTGGDSGDDDDGESVEATHQTLGDLVALFSAVCYSCYTVVIKTFVPDDDAVAMPLLFGYLGAFNMVFLAPVVLLAVLIGRGAIVEGLTPEVFGLICAGGFFNNVVSDYLWARAVVLTTPTIATVGLSLTIPLAFLSDAFFHGVFPAPMSAFGAACVVAGFVLVNAGDGSCEKRGSFVLLKLRLLAGRCARQPFRGRDGSGAEPDLA